MESKLVHLLACLGEECGEVQQVVGKSLRFGVYDCNPKTNNIPNLELIRAEVHDVLAMYEMLLDHLGEKCDIDGRLIEAKKTKVARFFEE